MALSTAWSKGSVPHRRSLVEIRASLMEDLKLFDVVSFCYEGAPFTFKDDFSAPLTMQLFKLQHIAKAKTAFVSDERELKSLQTYLARYAQTDREFKKRINFDSVRVGSREDSPFPGESKQDNFESYIEWSCGLACPREWGGLFSLKSTLTVEEWEKQFDTLWPKLHHILLLYHLELMSCYKDEFNPYLNMNIFSLNALKVLKHLASGQTSREIAEKLDMTERGVEYHINQLCTKLETKNRIHLIHVATKLGLV